MSYVICDKAGKYTECTKCPNTKPLHEHSEKKKCPAGDPLISFITKMAGKLILDGKTWKFRTTERMVLDVPLVNKTGRSVWNAKNEHKQKVVAWMEKGVIEIIRFANKTA